MRFLPLIILFFPIRVFSQGLLLNGGFEDINICTEYRVECAPEAWISSANGFANYFKDRNRSHKSLNSMAIEAGNFVHEYRRSFIRSRLVCGMRKGASYHLEFYLKTAHEVYDSIGILFSDVDPLFNREPLHKRSPAFYLQKYVAPLNISDSSWYKVEIDFIATGEERFIAFGYFARNDYVGERSHPLENRYYVFLDDIDLRPNDPNEMPCRNWAEMKEQIYDENERHTLLEKKISYYKKNPPPPPPVMRNVFLKIDTLVLPDILFASGKAVLQPESYFILDSLAARMKNVQVDSLIVEGHTDSVGTLAFNERLSMDRADAVKIYLANKTGFLSIIARGWAFHKPVADNRTPGGRQRNRRVEVYLYIRE